jgi:glutathione-independent formaldehyde dehydrogenase
MKAVVYQGPFKVAVEDVENPRIEHPNDVIVRITSSAICGSDLHMYEGRTAAEPGIVFGHENLGIVQEVGAAVTSIRQGDRSCPSTWPAASARTASPGIRGSA